MVAHVCELAVGEFVYTLGDYHIYKNHLDQVNEVLAREPLPCRNSRLLIRPGACAGSRGLLDMRYEDLKLRNYQSHGKIAAAVAV